MTENEVVAEYLGATLRHLFGRMQEELGLPPQEITMDPFPGSVGDVGVEVVTMMVTALNNHSPRAPIVGLSALVALLAAALCRKQADENERYMQPCGETLH